MHWKTKALIQNLVAKLPEKLSYSCYYWLQRNFGGLRSSRLSPFLQLRAGVRVADWIRKHGQQVEGKEFLEIGTGRRLNTPIALWLCGAKRVTTVDLNPYLKEELIVEDLQRIGQDEGKLRQLFQEYEQEPGFSKRWQKLQSISSLAELKQTIELNYYAPADATDLPQLSDESVDYHFSYNVLEHIPPGVLKKILKEGSRVLRKTGFFIHLVDLSDHFAHQDPSISRINYLRFSEQQWDKYAGNRYMYQNRLRTNEYREIFESAGLEICALEEKTDEEALEFLRSGFPVAERFQGYSPENNAVIRINILAKPNKGENSQ